VSSGKTAMTKRALECTPTVEAFATTTPIVGAMILAQMTMDQIA
jgi:hypothetical protein